MIKCNINITPPPPHYIGIKLYVTTTAAYLYRNWLAKAKTFLLFTSLIFSIDIIFSKFFNFNKYLHKFNLSALKHLQVKNGMILYSCYANEASYENKRKTGITYCKCYIVISEWRREE